ncbi:MAG: hypothetical protein MAG795_00607 [Candidatus Woesearchaeota archaeon]|nr:hypothetical protein [Candidatus Woesearchaeota archaeon]
MRRRKKKNNSKIISIILAFVLVSSMLGIIVGKDTKQTNKYNGYEFTQQGEYWYFQHNNKNYRILNYPSSLENLDFDSNIVKQVQTTKMVYITIPVTGQNLEYIGTSAFDLSQFLGEQGIYPINSVSNNQTDYELPYITCTNATIPIPVIAFEQSNQTKAYAKNNCLILSANTGYDYIQLKDRFLLEYLGVMKNE